MLRREARPRPRRALEPSRAPWRPSWLTWLVCVLGLLGLAVGLYPSTSAWMSEYNQARLLDNYEVTLREVHPPAEEQLALARHYNDLLSSGAVLESGGNVPLGDGALQDGAYDYNSILTASDEGLMGRVTIGKIGVDLPIYHGTSDEVLLKGAGHLEGTHLPIGGEGTRSVITAHRGLASATMFTNLDKIGVGDEFHLEVFGEKLYYRVAEVLVIDPEDTQTLRAEPGRDLVTLITCTPLGINSHRIVVTGERMDHDEEQTAAQAPAPVIPGFPWFAVIAGVGLLLLGAYVWRRGFADTAPGAPE